MHIETQQAEMIHCCGFQFKITNTTWDEIFITAAIHPLVTAAIDRSCLIYNGGKFVKQMNESFRNSVAMVLNLEKFYDWDALFR